MASASLGNGGVGSSRSINGFKGSSSSVDWLGREMLEMRLRDKTDTDEERVSFWINCCLYFLESSPDSLLKLMRSLIIISRSFRQFIYS